uniref:Uncharacterized protein n=1 Tax=Megaselia scalaris TaxID=36166 RepID=T1GYH0_MEGSC
MHSIFEFCTLGASLRLIFRKLFTALTEIVVELIHHSDFDSDTREVLATNVSNLSKAMLHVEVT